MSIVEIKKETISLHLLGWSLLQVKLCTKRERDREYIDFAPRNSDVVLGTDFISPNFFDTYWGYSFINRTFSRDILGWVIFRLWYGRFMLTWIQNSIFFFFIPLWPQWLHPCHSLMKLKEKVRFLKKVLNTRISDLSSGFLEFLQMGNLKYKNKNGNI